MMMMMMIIIIIVNTGTFCQNRRKCSSQVSNQRRGHSKGLRALLTAESVSCIYRDQGADGFGRDVGSSACLFPWLRGRHACSYGGDRGHLY